MEDKRTIERNDNQDSLKWNNYYYLLLKLEQL